MVYCRRQQAEDESEPNKTLKRIVAPSGHSRLAFRSAAGGDTAMEPSWKQADAFPVITRVIEQVYREHQRFITAQEIAAPATRRRKP